MWKIVFTVLLSLWSFMAEGRPPQLITEDYGIVTKDDLAYDAKNREETVYNPSKDLFGRFWQCVPVSAVSIEHHPSLGEDPMKPAGIEEVMCDIEIQVKLPQEIHVYGDRRRHPEAFCREFDQNWKKLTRNEKVVCLNGEDPSTDVDPSIGKYRAWVWDKFKTMKGCYSYFGDCEVKGCAAGHCPGVNFRAKN